jgi:hypothetical protein
MRPSVRAYRTLLWLYPPAFRHEYGDHMVAVFEEMLRDDPAARVWGRVAVDVATSIPIQHTEAVMATRFSPNVVGLLSVLFFAVGATPLLFTDAWVHWWLGLPVLGAFVASAASALYWRSHWQYVEERALHHRWYAFVAGGGLLLGGVVVGEALNVDDVMWPIFIGMVLTGSALIGVGILLALWNGFAALRRRGDNGVWPAS